ncbi:hypothetical protein DENSPDRAFT_319329 [Dentipellis sp. KUC8613]|nr:hypothetical protein DENSPDRAFT_319329 [Dentipellis sp. KUC8613]
MTTTTTETAMVVDTTAQGGAVVESAVATTPLARLQAQIDTLNDFATRVRELRGLPSLLLHPTSDADPVAAPLGDVLRRVLKETSVVRGSLMEDKVQGALRAAAESAAADAAGIRVLSRRETRKRKRSPSPESPRPFPAFQPKAASLFPVEATPPPPMTLSRLPGYVREFNTKHARKAALHVWQSTARESRELRVPLVMRFLIPDVMRAFITLGHPVGEGGDLPVGERPLLVENVTAFGSREKKPPHSQSDYLVFQKLSQQILRMLQSTPRVPFETLMDLLSTYRTLFSEQCTSCQRVLSAEGYIPPVGRVWLEQEGKTGVWEPQHVTCLTAQN